LSTIPPAPTSADEIEQRACDVAIVGMACILPGGVISPESLWTLLCEGRDAIIEVPADRWTLDGVYAADPQMPGRAVTRWGGFIEGVDLFDPAFFGISPREGALMDPQQRLLLQTAWRALEDAGIPAAQIAGSPTGVYIGISHSDYHGIQKFGRYEIDVHTSTGGALSIAANRLSHRLDLRGPSLAVDTACSSSLVALDLACRAIERGECGMALVGGVNLMLTPDVTITFSRAAMLSPDGRCKAFDARANGYVRGEGAGVVVLKPLARARADGDRVRAVIRATAVNQDGQTSTLTVPSLDAQVAMLREVCGRAGVNPAQVPYVEAHGTGTAVGDPIEAQAIGAVFGSPRAAGERCLIGSIKTNIGHLEPAAGIAGLIKAALCVEHGKIPPSLHFTAANPNIDMEAHKLAVCTRLAEFPRVAAPRLAAVNSFGFGGTNASAILQEPPAADLERADGAGAGGRAYPILLPLSAATPASLRANAATLADVLAANPRVLADVAGTLSVRRDHLAHRAMAVIDADERAPEVLRAFATGQDLVDAETGRIGDAPKIGFVFTGQGAQWWAMGRRLLNVDPTFREAIEACDAGFEALSGWSVIDELRRDEAASRIDSTRIAQPATFALQVGLAARWQAWGIRPAAVIGHSIGEMAAAYVCGALSLADAITVVHHRSRLQETTRHQGAMAALGLAPAAARRLIDEAGLALEIAAINGPDLTTVGGAPREIDLLMDLLRADPARPFGRRLHVDYAFHTRQMDPFAAELRASLAGIVSGVGEIAMYSTVTGTAASAHALDAEYWWRNMREPVLFQAAVEAAVQDGINTFVEIGAHPVLSGPVRACLAAAGRAGTVVASLQRELADQVCLGRALGKLYVNGVTPDWRAVVPPGWRFVPLPGQPFEAQRLWAESEESRAARLDGPVHPLLGMRLRTASPRWQAHIGARMPRFLGDHRIDGATVFPASAYVEQMLAAARETLGEPPWELEGIVFHDALALPDEGLMQIETSIAAERGAIEIASRSNGDATWTARASGRVRAWNGRDHRLAGWQPATEPPSHVEHSRFYQVLQQEGHDFGPSFRGVRTLWRERGEALGSITLPPEAADGGNYVLHPALLDACLQVIRGLADISDDAPREDLVTLPVSIATLRVFRRPGTSVLSRATAVEQTGSEIVCDIDIIDDVGHPVAAIRGLRCRRLRAGGSATTDAAPGFYREHWIEVAREESQRRADGRSYLVLGDGGRVAHALAEELRARGARVSIESASADPAGGGPDGRTVIEAALAASGPADEIIVVATLDGKHSHEPSPDPAVIEGFVALLQLCARTQPHPSITILADGVAQCPGDPPRSPFFAPVVGLVRTARNEMPDLLARVIDTGSHGIVIDRLAEEVLRGGGEPLIALRGDKRLACRLGAVAEESLPLATTTWQPKTRMPPFRVTMSAPGALDRLRLREMASPRPQPGEVLVEVRAVGLNFRDVMAATALLPADAETAPAWQHLGLECAGVVREVGEGCDPGLVGQRVIAMTPGALASHVTAPAALVIPIPDKLSFANGAALPTAYATAQYALCSLARLQVGETVLIHAATGGVGLAAVAIARRCGARIIATAGRPEKRDYLRARGVLDVFDSRSLAFADDVLAATQGRGVDVVLNSLPGPYLEKSLSLLAPGGRFLEIGKRDVYGDSLIGLRSLRRNAAFFVVDLAGIARERPQAVVAELQSVIHDLDAGKLELLPVELFCSDEVAGAFRHMANADHIGKIVITHEQPAEVELDRESSRMIRPDATYLVTGGLGGFGLAIAQWLASQGARSLALIGRSGGARAEAQSAVAAMCAAGVDVMAIAADVSDAAQVSAALRAIAATGRPLCGIIHAAGIIDDTLLGDLDADRVRRVFAPKAVGAWHLHSLTAGLPLDFFVCCSSVAGLVGSVGQAHYAAANRFLDALAAMRQAQRLPGLSIAWGPIADAGFLTRRPDIARHLEQGGMRPIPVQAALDALASLLLRTCDTIAVADIAAPLVARALPATAGSGYLAELVSSDARGHAAPESLRSRWLQLPAVGRPSFIADFLRHQIGAVLKTAPSSIEEERPLAELGLDSLTSFELKNRIESAIDASLPITKFLQKPTVRQLADVIGEKLDQPAENALRPAAARPADMLPLMSISQEALWFVDRLDPGNPGYGLAMCISVRPQLDMNLVDAAFRRVIERHESLRMVFAADNSGPMPRLLEPADFTLARHDAVARDEAAFRGELDREGNRPFDLARGPLVRIHIYRRADRDVLLLHFHHIVADAASIVIAAQDMFEAYFALRAGAAPRWPRAIVPPAAFARYQRELVRGTAAQPHIAFWREQLDGAPPVMPLPTDHPRPSRGRPAGRSRTLTIPRTLTEAIKGLARREGETLYAVLLAAFNVLLHRLGGGSDIVVGTPTLGRSQTEFADAVGYLVNAVPIRTRIDAGMTFKEVLAETGIAVRAALEHQEFPFASLVRELKATREAGINPIFQVMFAMERPAEIDSHGFAATLLNVDGAAIRIREFDIESVALNRNRAQFDLGWVVEEHDGEIFGVVDYNGDLWTPETIDRFAELYGSILDGIGRSVEQPIMEPASRASRESVLAGDALPDAPDVMASFRRSAAAFPENIALVFGERSWTYRQLAETVGLTARALRAHGVGPGSLIGICMSRAGNLVAALLATLDIGAAYIPLDPAHPAARFGRMLSDARPTLVISDAAHTPIVKAFAPCRVVDLDATLAMAAGGETGPDGAETDASSAQPELAYVIYTSGSTGGPLGVDVRRASLSNLLAAIPREVPLAANDVLLAVTTVAFDIAALELLLPLMLGAAVVIADEATVTDGRRLAQRLRAGGITTMQATPATWQMLIDAGWTGDVRLKALVGGERLPQPLAAALIERCGGVWNLYGPTETTIWSTCARIVSSAEPIPIGRPIANTICRVVDAGLDPVTPGHAGELLIGGAGVARGYAQADELTKARFVTLPSAPGARWFRTGDMVRLVGDGLVFLGRRDQQVKVRGYRVELGEIESTLVSCAGVREAAAVTVGSDLASTRIVAFVAPTPECALQVAEVRDELERVLPGYMVPARIECLPALPRLPNGKLDRASLARIATAEASGQATAAARSPLEKTLVEVLREILRAEAIGIHDDFFAIGGTSLLGLRYLARVSEVCGVDLGPAELLRAPTVAAMAELIATARSPDPAPLENAGAAAPQWRPLALARAEGVFAAVDAAALACLPEALVRAARATSLRGEDLDAIEPYWLGLCRVLGRTLALIILPISERDLLTNEPRSREAANAAIAYAARLGARCVALTGLIPSTTDFGRTLAPASGCSVTTGHAATATAVALTAHSACQAAARDLRHESVVFVGLGAIGTASLFTLLGRGAHPARLVLCDVPAKRSHLEHLAREIRGAHAFRGTVDVVTRSSLPDEAYQCRFFVCATNVTGVLDIARLRPGSIVIDDSFPLCFDLHNARERIAAHGDILCLSAGSVSVETDVDWSFALPPRLQSLRRDELVRSMLPRNDIITGCMLSALLPAIADLHPTIGPVTAADCLRYWDGMKLLRVAAAPLHCGPWTATPADLARFLAAQSQQDAPTEMLGAK
jgi:amino acid adenylation domain-containing protein